VLAGLGFGHGECRCEAWEVTDFGGKALARFQLAVVSGVPSTEIEDVSALELTEDGWIRYGGSSTTRRW
jgi:hypothetical protein